ncbi:MAG: carbohydrate porin [Candidatus Binatia bacterium]
MRAIGLIALLLVAARLQASEDGGAGAPAAPPAPIRISLPALAASGVRDWLALPYMTGRLGGARDLMQSHGVSLDGVYQTDILGNATGGIDRKVRYYHDISLVLGLDLEKIARLPGARFVASMSSRAGVSLSDEDIGNVFNVAQVCCEPQTRLVDLAWEQTLWNRRLSYRIGHLATGDDFAASPFFDQFVTSGIDANPGSLAFNVPFTEYPAATAGAMVKLRPLPHWFVQAGVYNGSASNVGRKGVNLGFDVDQGILVVAETGYRLAPPIGGQKLPGHYRVGGYYHTGRFSRFDAPSGSQLPSDNEYGNGGYYFLLDQTVYRRTGATQGGVSPFLSLAFAPSEEINEFPFFFNAGVVYDGPFASRPNDAILFGILYGAFSRDLRRSQAGSPSGQQDFEMVLEWSYVIALGPWLQFQPDIQYVVRPGGTGNIPDSLVLGAQITVEM